METGNHYILSLLAAGLFIMSSCGTSKAVSKDTLRQSPQSSLQTSSTSSAAQLSFVQKVSDTRVYAQDIVGSMTLTVKSGDNDISAPGSLHMRWNKVIRLQAFIPLLGTEVGRIEFTPTYVLVIDRIHKEYVKADYSQVDFLRDNGLSFYSLQSLFWNQLLVPGKQEVSESDLKKFSAEIGGSDKSVPVSLSDNKMKYVWQADKTSGQIQSAKVTYTSAHNGNSTLDWVYSDFRSLGVKLFPAYQQFTFFTTATNKPQQASLTLELNEVDTDSKWDDQSTVSPKYKEMKAEDVLGKIMKMN
jgi:hypothetical protein